MKTSLFPSPSAMPLDLELPKIRVPSSSVAADEEASSNGDAGAIQIVASEDGECCRTPTSSEHRIQAAAASCPPAPRKPRAVPSRRKRTREFFDVANRDEVEGFFRSCELALHLRDGPRGAVVKRRYLSKGFVVAIL